MFWRQLLDQVVLGNTMSRSEWKVNPSLVAFVEGVAGMCGHADGELRSRQVIALAVVTWNALNPEQSTVKAL